MLPGYYCLIVWSIRHIVRKLDLIPSVIAKGGLELVQQGLLSENEKISSVDGNEWTPERRFSVVIETTTLSEMELADYCRRMGVFVEQVREWRAISIQAHEMKMAESRRADKELREAKTRLRELEKELLRKDKAMAEVAALLMLREKFNALWDNSEEG